METLIIALFGSSPKCHRQSGGGHWARLLTGVLFLLNSAELK